MKTKLTPSQSQRLIELGVDAKLASSSTKVYEQLTERVRWESKLPIFDLSDILSLLPTEIKIQRNGDTLGMMYHCGQWRAGYSNDAVYCDHTKVAPELIDALFELLVWCITNKHLKL